MKGGWQRGEHGKRHRRRSVLSVTKKPTAATGGGGSLWSRSSSSSLWSLRGLVSPRGNSPLQLGKAGPAGRERAGLAGGTAPGSLGTAQTPAASEHLSLEFSGEPDGLFVFS